MFLKCLTFSFVALGLVPAIAHAQRPTIPVAVAEGVLGRTRTAPSGRPPSVSDILSKTDVVVRGIVGEPRAYLSGDGRDVYTDYVVRNAVVWFDSQVASSPLPGSMPAITVTQLGGTIVINGLEYIHKEEGLPPLTPGMEALFLLQRVKGRYEIAGTFYGAFRIVSGTLLPLTSEETFAPEYRNVAADQAVAGMVTQLRALTRRR